MLLRGRKLVTYLWVSACVEDFEPDFARDPLLTIAVGASMPGKGLGFGRRLPAYCSTLFQSYLVCKKNSIRNAPWIISMAVEVVYYLGKGSKKGGSLGKPSNTKFPVFFIKFINGI